MATKKTTTRPTDAKRITSSRTEQLKKLGSPLAKSKPSILTPNHGSIRRSLLKNAFPPSSTAKGSTAAAAIPSRIQHATVAGRSDNRDGDADGIGQGLSLGNGRTTLLQRLHQTRRQAGVEAGREEIAKKAALRSAGVATATRGTGGAFSETRNSKVAFAHALAQESPATTSTSMYAEAKRKAGAGGLLHSLAHRAHTARNHTAAAASDNEVSMSHNGSQSAMRRDRDKAAAAVVAAAQRPMSTPSSSFPTSEQTDKTSQSFNETLFGLEGLSFTLGEGRPKMKKAEGDRTAEKVKKREEEEAEKDMQRGIDLAKECSDVLRTKLDAEFEAQDEAAKTAYQRIGQLVKGASTISEAMHATFQGAVGQWEAYEADVAELGDAMATAHSEILQQLNDTAGTIRDILGKMQEEKQSYEEQRLGLFHNFRKKAKDQFSKYEVDRDELLKVAAAVNDTKASEKQIRSTAMALIQSL
ncbi:unnamed protein product [Tilletia laevis]|uniref:Uncharacterized protein n=2 Tax=Tilletia TaxID=13289 RepID=A0A177URI2_9BASI|nr:hypothetical protein CF336_g3382 [Tilletia laevis]KAE8256785.1 hypothetical protein A4X03_0g5059 [Tilletia caries]CAD6974622.1 unnamed protein product [Tilletia controversa]KAE8204656.1 hypothetical protein CF335_g2575 [Tilletia laevis]CAD6887344.1 unnamed protein product [Tilletia caries]